jgi:para-nitrobenzyl esterase
MGACHGLEVGYVFDNLYADGNDMLSAVELTDPEVRRDLAMAMHRTWTAFARTGDPGWPAYDESRPVMVYAGSGGTVVNDPRGDERAIWTA